MSQSSKTTLQNETLAKLNSLPIQTNKSPLIFIIAGEASGDQLGADLMASLKSIADVRFAGIGGEGMEAQGLQSLFPMQELSIMGVWGIIKNLPHLLKRLTYTVETIEELNPDVVVTIDAPEFCFRVMKRLNSLTRKPRLIHYVAPAVWAWRPGRAKKISAYLDRLLCVYPFEPPYFEPYGLKSTFVGHPIGKSVYVPNIERDTNLLCVLPGSRRSEIEMLLPVFRETVTQLKQDIPDLKVVIPTISSLEPLIRLGTKDWPVEVELCVGDPAREEVFQKATAALAKSGTVTLQLSAARLPFVVAYKISNLNAWVGSLLIQTPWACMVNIMMAFHKFGPKFKLSRETSKLVPEPWIPEFIQKNCTADKLAPAIKTLMVDAAARDKELYVMDTVMKLLKAPPNAAALAIVDELEQSCVSKTGVV